MSLKDALIDHLSSCEECSERNDRIYEDDKADNNELLREIEQCYEDEIAIIDTESSLFNDQMRGTL